MQSERHSYRPSSAIAADSSNQPGKRWKQFSEAQIQRTHHVESTSIFCLFQPAYKSVAYKKKRVLHFWT